MSRSKVKSRSDRAGCVGAMVIVILIVVVVALTILIIRALSGEFGNQRANVLVPDVRGMTVNEAIEKLSPEGLKLRQRDPIFSDEVEIGKIVHQDPTPNRLVKQGRSIEVSLSKGPNAYLMPNLVGLDLELAQQRLKETHLYLGRVEKIINPGMQEGVVVSQTPVAGVKMPASTAVDLVVSVKKTDETTPMPDLVGAMLTNAEGLLSAQNLMLRKVKYVHHPNVEFGQIVSQDPPAGRAVTLGTGVTIEVAVDQNTFAAVARNFRIRVKVPKGPETQEVKIAVDDRLGNNEVYKQRHRVGEVITQQIKVEGPARIIISVDGRVIREDII